MDRDLAKVLVSRDQIAKRVAALGQKLALDLEAALARDGGSDSDGRIVLIPIMTGALVFAADLIRQMPLKLSLKLVAVSSYPGTSVMSKGAKLASELPPDLSGKHIVVIDDILDSGQTLGLVRELIEAQNPASVRICVLLRKPDAVRKREVEVEYIGFEIPDEFVVGYGLDYDGYYRNIPDIATLKPSVAGVATAVQEPGRT